MPDGISVTGATDNAFGAPARRCPARQGDVSGQDSHEGSTTQASTDLRFRVARSSSASENIFS